MARRTNMDVLREHLPGDVPLHELEGLAMALNVYYCEELVKAHERGARAMRRKVITELEMWRANYNQAREDARRDGQTRTWWISVARLLLVNRVIVMMRQINEEEDL